MLDRRSRGQTLGITLPALVLCLGCGSAPDPSRAPSRETRTDCVPETPCPDETDCLARCQCQGGSENHCRTACESAQPDETASAFLARVNELRTAGGCCGGECFAPAPPLELSVLLTRAARLHADAMATEGYLSHLATDGRDPFDRMRDAGFSGCAMAENLARHIADPDTVVNAWLASAEHCENLFWDRLRLMGIGHAVSPDSMQDYWVQNLGG